jgi:hypothetical protein
VAKKPNPLKPVEIQLALNERTAWYLDRLIEAGLYGNTRSQAASVVVYDHCKLLIAQGKLLEIPPMAGASALEVNPTPSRP